MRLWHKDLIHYLPKQQLLGQWRELNSIYKLENRHILINFVYEESDWQLYNYSQLVIEELAARGYRFNLDNFWNYFEGEMDVLPSSDIYTKKMTSRYLKQCLYNLQEKYDCGGITDEEWQLITDHFDID